MTDTFKDLIDLFRAAKATTAAYEAMSPLEKARHNYDQCRSWVRGGIGLDHPEMSIDEIERLIDKVFAKMGVIRP